MHPRKIWQLPVIRKEGDEDKKRAVTWLELFFDLFFVIVIASISNELSFNLTLTGIKDFVIAFIPVWWIWIGATIYYERFETDGIEIRLFTFLLMVPVAGMAVFSHDIMGENLQNFLFSYVLGRLIIIYLWSRAGYHSKIFRPVALRYIVGFSISVILVTIAALIKSKISLVLFPVALLIDLHTPFFTVNLQKKLPRFTRSKLPERYGLFTIIVLGEVVAGIIRGMSQHAHFSASHIPLGIIGIATALGFWWLYFDFIARRPFHKNVLVTIMWSYTHMPLVISFVLVGAGLDNLLSMSPVPSQAVIATYLSIVGSAIILIGLLELTLERSPDTSIHPVISPFFKFITGSISIILGIYGIIDSSFFALLTGFLLILINILYGTYTWIKQVQ